MTSALSPTPKPAGGIVRILQITDFHFLSHPGDTLLGVDTERSFAATLADVLAKGEVPDLALLTGDLAQDASLESYRRLRGHLSGLPCPAYCLPGNHDDPALLHAELCGGSIHCQPDILLPHWRIICLDSAQPHSPIGHLRADQLALLESLLGRQAGHHILIALHHHPVPSGSAWMDTMQLDNGPELFECLSRHPAVRGIVFGHIHQEFDLEHQGLRLLGTPSTCFQFLPAQAEFALDPRPPGYRWIELHPDGRIDTHVARSAILPPGLQVDSSGY